MDVELEHLFLQPLEPVQLAAWSLSDDICFAGPPPEGTYFEDVSSGSIQQKPSKAMLRCGAPCPSLAVAPCTDARLDAQGGYQQNPSCNGVRSNGIYDVRALPHKQQSNTCFKPSLYMSAFPSSSFPAELSNHTVSQADDGTLLNLQPGCRPPGDTRSTHCAIPACRPPYLNIENQHRSTRILKGGMGSHITQGAPGCCSVRAAPHRNQPTHSSLYTRYKQAATAQVIGSISSKPPDGIQQSSSKPAHIQGNAGSTRYSWDAPLMLEETANSLAAMGLQTMPQQMVYAGTKGLETRHATQQSLNVKQSSDLAPTLAGKHQIGLGSKLGKVPASKTTLYKHARLDHIRSMQLLDSKRQPNQPVGNGPNTSRQDSALGTQGMTTAHPHYVLGAAAVAMSCDAPKEDFQCGWKAPVVEDIASRNLQARSLERLNPAQTLLHSDSLPGAPRSYLDHNSPAALACANAIMSRIKLPGGIKVVPLLDDSFMCKLGRTCDFTAMSMVLGASYFQRLVHALPVLASAVYDSHAFQPSQVESCAEQISKAGLELQHDVNLCSINFVCMYLAQKVCDRPPSLELLRSVLSSLFGSTVGYQQAYAVEAMCLDKLDWRLGPYFSDDDVCSWVHCTDCMGWIPN